MEHQSELNKKALLKIFAIGIAMRITMLAFTMYMDCCGSFKISDIDYQVVTDGARYVWNGSSPFNRHTYRYTPILAFLMTPSIFLNYHFGKVLLVACDVIVGILIYYINKKRELKVQKTGLAIWLYNPFIISLSTRGSSDVIMSILILITLILLKQRRYNLGAFFYGLAIHFKIYPIIFCIGFYLYIMKKEKKHFFNLDSIRFGVLTVLTLASLTLLFYWMYGFQFLHEAYLYHLSRKDHRHNYSILFMYIYYGFNTIDRPTSMMIMFIPLFLIISISVRFYGNIKLVCYLTSMIFVTYNKVATAQYFIWYLQFVPILIYELFTKISAFELKLNIYLFVFWFFIEVGWNLFAYQFEALGKDSFIFIHITNCVFFAVNIMLIFSNTMNYHIFKKRRMEEKEQEKLKKD